jgi:hypothetical protein
LFTWIRQKSFGHRAWKSWRKNSLKVELQGHAALRERVPPALVVFFAYMAEPSMDPSTSPAFVSKKKEQWKQPTVKLRKKF